MNDEGRRHSAPAPNDITLRSKVAREGDVRDGGEPVAVGILAACLFADLAERAARAGDLEAARKLADVAALAAAAVAGVDAEPACGMGAPAVLIRVALEETPRLFWNVKSAADKARLFDHLRAHPDQLELLTAAVEIADREQAA